MGLPEALTTLNGLKEKEIIQDYAIGGGWAVIYYSVPYLSYDLDIFVILKDEGDFHRIYDYFRSEGNKIEDVYIYIEEMPVQFLPNFISPLFREVVERAHEIIIEGVHSKIATIEHLIILALDTFRDKDKYRIRQLYERADPDLLDNLLDRYDNEDGKFRKRYKSVLAGT